MLLCFRMGGESAGSHADSGQDHSLRLGVGVHDATHFCVAVEHPRLAVGSRVVVVSPLDRTWSEAVVTGAASQNCPGTADSTAESSYNLRLLKGKLPNTIALIGVVSGLNSFSLAGDQVIASDANGKTATFRACLADGGVYLSLWPGKPLEGDPIWRGFRFVDFDMDAENCTPKDQSK